MGIKIGTAVIAAALIILFLSGCNGIIGKMSGITDIGENIAETGGDKDDAGNSIKWPQDKMGDLPDPKVRIESIDFDESSKGCTVGFSGMKDENAKKYIESMKKLKYEKVEETAGEYGIAYTGEKSDGTMAMFMYNSGEGTIVYTPLSKAPVSGKPDEPSDDTGGGGSGSGSGTHNPGFSDGGLGSYDHSGEDDGDMTDIEPWPEEFFAGIPRLEGKITAVEEISGKEMCIYFSHVEMADAEKYIKTLKSIGFTQRASETSGKDFLRYSAFNNKGYCVELSYQPGKTAYVSLVRL